MPDKETSKVATLRELVNLQEVNHQIETGIQAAIEQLAALKLNTADPVEALRITTVINELNWKLYRVRAEYSAFMAEQGELHMPTAEDVQKAKDYAMKIAALVAGDATVDEILSFTTKLLKAWNGGKIAN